MTFRVAMTRAAEDDLDRILGHLATRSAQLARRLLTRFEEARARLESMPFACGLSYEGRTFSREIRHVLFGTSRKRKYRALFVVDGDEVTTLTIRAPGQEPARPEDLFH